MRKIRRSKKMYEEYVCPDCFNTVDKCVCKIYPPRHIIHIDKDIQEHIRILNQKGYKTVFSCSSHWKDYKNSVTEIYIYFVNWVEFSNIPYGFTKDTKHNIIRYKYSKNLSDEEFKQIQKEQLYNLLKWCNELPEYKR
jgi:hypothetical protein